MLWHFLLTALLFSGVLSAELFDPVALYLTWQKSPETTMTIRWITPLDMQDDLLEYQPEGSSEWLQTKGTHAKLPREAPYMLHSVELSHLMPNTRYLFRMGRDSVVYKFQTMPAHAAQTEIRFIAGGDIYHDALSFVRATNVQAARTSPHFALIGGDIAYAAHATDNAFFEWIFSWIGRGDKQTVDRWLDWLKAWKEDMVTPEGCLIPMLPVIGNHDTDGRYDQSPDKAPFFYALFAMPGARGYNVLDFGGPVYMSLFLLDSGHTHPVGGAQRQWLATTLAQRREVQHKFALYHVPAYPSVRAYSNTRCSAVRKEWVPLFEKYQLTAAFENHDHQFKRTHPLLQGKVDPHGIRYFGDGGWGVEKPRETKDLKKKWYLAKTIPSRHFLYVVLKGNSKTVSAISPSGELLDQVHF